MLKTDFVVSQPGAARKFCPETSDFGIPKRQIFSVWELADGLWQFQGRFAPRGNTRQGIAAEWAQRREQMR